jgi:DeoR/GlpR family transcriptional regulator of sugar metabolism
MKVKIREAAEILGVSMDTVHRRLKTGESEGEKVFEGGVEIWLIDQKLLPIEVRIKQFSFC